MTSHPGQPHRHAPEHNHSDHADHAAHDHHRHDHSHGHACSGSGACSTGSGGSCCAGSGGCGEAESSGCCGGGHAHSHVYVFSRHNIRELDRRAVEQYHIPSILLMENAARGITGAVLEAIDGDDEARVLIVCGPGNNGGDGLAAARHLHNAGVPVCVLLAGSDTKLAPDTKANLEIVRAMNLPLVHDPDQPDRAFDSALAKLPEPTLILDALLGTGVDRGVTAPMSQFIARINAQHAKGCTVFAVDLPSGLDADTGSPALSEGGTPGACVKADMTITLAGLKEGFLADHARAHVGDLIVVDIGAPVELLQSLGEMVHV